MDNNDKGGWEDSRRALHCVDAETFQTRNSILVRNVEWHFRRQQQQSPGNPTATSALENSNRRYFHIPELDRENGFLGSPHTVVGDRPPFSSPHGITSQAAIIPIPEQNQLTEENI